MLKKSFELEITQLLFCSLWSSESIGMKALYLRDVFRKLLVSDNRYSLKSRLQRTKALDRIVVKAIGPISDFLLRDYFSKVRD